MDLQALQRQRPQQVERCIVERQQLAAQAPVYILRDEAGDRYMKMSEEGLFLWQLMDGAHTIEDLCRAYVARFARPAPGEALHALARLYEGGFVRFQDTAGSKSSAAPMGGGKPRPSLSLCTYYCWLSDMDRKVAALYRCLRWAYHPLTQAVLLIIAGAGAIAFAWPAAGGPIWTAGAMAGSLPVWLAGLALHVVVHEAAHALTCKHFGRRVNRAGIGWYFFAPVAFVDTSDIWAAARLPRILVSAAGPYSNLVLSGMAALAAHFLAPGDLKDALWSFSLTGYVLALVNLNPLLELDGYYIVMDLLEIPNLRARALAHLGSVLCGRAQEEPRLGMVFMVFGAASLAYGIALGLGILWAYSSYIDGIAGAYLPNQFAQAIGWILAGSLSLIILHRLFDGLRLRQGR
ncbi:MAG TPA: PqqD family peptide modification chaperone [Xanthobacteraceae bacterium]